jgi:hypothetical protein
MRFLRGIVLAAQAAAALSIGKPRMVVERESDGLQDVVSSLS